MEKQEAQAFIIQHLELGDKKDEIVAELSWRLGAPIEMVRRFVNQVIEDYHSSQISVENVASNLNSLDPEGYRVTPSIDEDESLYLSNLSSGSQAEGSQTNRMDGVVVSTPSRADIQSSLKTENYSTQNEIDDNELEKFIVMSLKKHRRYSDIVQAVCESTGWGWNKAQLFVAKTQTKNHQELTRSNRIFMIPFSGIFIVGGLLLLLWSILALIDYYNGFTGRGTNTLPIDFIIIVIGSFFSSLGIIAGGIYGLYRTLSNQ